MRCYQALPAAEIAPGVLVCMHAPGVNAFVTAMVNRLAEAGFAAIAPDLYHRQDQPAATPLEAMNRLRDSEVLIDLAAATRALAEEAAVDGARLGVIGFCMGGRCAFLQAANDPTLSAAVVFYAANIKQAWGEGAAPIEQAAGIRAPVLGIFGADDTNPSPADVADMDAALTAAGVEHELHSYQGAGHAFLNSGRPSAYREAAANHAWSRCLAWLGQHL